MDIPPGLIVFGGVAAFIVLLAASFLIALWAIRGSSSSRAVASVSAAPGTPFILRFTTSSPRAHRIWLRFEVEYDNPLNVYIFGLTAETQVQVGAGPASLFEVRIGHTAPALGPNGVRAKALYRRDRYRVKGRPRVRATAEIASLAATPPGSLVQIGGRVMTDARSTAKSLLVFVVPV